MELDASRGEVSTPSGARGEKLGFFARIVLFFRQMFAELRKVVTPTKKQLINYTLVVLAFVIIMMALTFGLDTLFTWVTKVVFGAPQ